MKKIVLKLVLLIIISCTFFMPAVFHNELYAAEGSNAKVSEEFLQLAEIAYKLEEKGEYREALNKYREFMDNNPNHPDLPYVLTFMTHICLSMCDIESAIEAQNKIVEKYEDTEFDEWAQISKWFLDILQVIKLEKDGKFDEAISGYKNLQENYLDDESLIEWTQDAIDAITYYQAGEKKKALKIYKYYLKRRRDTYMQNWAHRGINRYTKKEPEK